MKEVLARNWWVFVVRGVLAIAFGAGAFAVPDITLAALVLVYGAYALADGLMAAVSAFGRHRPGDDFPWSGLFVGLAGILAGVLTFLYPGLTALLLLYLIAAWHVVRGTFEIAAAIRLRKAIEGEGLLLLGFRLRKAAAGN